MSVTWQTAQALSAACGFAATALLPVMPIDGFTPNAEAAKHGIIAEPAALLDGAASVLVAAMPFPWHTPWQKGYAEVSAFYFASQRAHEAISKLAARLTELGARISSQQNIPQKVLGQRAGLGVLGRNTLLRNPAWGSCFTLRTLVTDIQPQPELLSPTQSYPPMDIQPQPELLPPTQSQPPMDIQPQPELLSPTQSYPPMDIRPQPELLSPTQSYPPMDIQPQPEYVPPWQSQPQPELPPQPDLRHHLDLTPFQPTACPACGDCRRCVDACPTRALDGHGNLVTERCIRTYMLAGVAVPEWLRGKMGTRLLGCEICQRACPHNDTIPAISPQMECFAIERLLAGRRQDLHSLGKAIGWNEARLGRVQAQAALAAGNSGDMFYRPMLRALADHENPTVATHAAWALEQLTNWKGE